MIRLFDLLIYLRTLKPALLQLKFIYVMMLMVALA